MDYMVVINYENLKKLCLNCDKLNTEDYWCKECSSKLLQQDFPNWTSGNNLLIGSFKKLNCMLRVGLKSYNGFLIINLKISNV